MKNCFDEFEYRGGRIVCSGWAVPDTPEKPLEIAVKDEMGRPLDIRLVKVLRADVGAALFQNPAFDMYGFYMEIPYVKEKKQTICFYVDNEDKESMEVVYSPLKLYWKYKKKKSLPAMLKRYLKSEDKENFWLYEKYMDYDKKDREYAIWKEKTMPGKKELEEQSSKIFSENTRISIVMPVYRPHLPHMKQMIDSILAQTYGNWELCVAYAGRENDEAGQYLNELVRTSRKVKVKFLSKNDGIAGNTNEAIKLASGEWIAFVDQDDLLRQDALYEYARAIHMKDVDVLYCDEDKLNDETGVFFEPHFKPDFNMDLLCSNNYICHMLMVRTSIVKQVGELDNAMNGAQDHDFILRCCQYTKKFGHISKILYSWRCHADSTSLNPESKMYAYDAGKNAIEQHYARLGISASVETMIPRGWYKTTFHHKTQPLVSILIPNKDHAEDLTRCINSILTKATWQNYEILIIENNSTKTETFECYRHLMQQDARVCVITWEGEFNYAAINNFAAEKARGEYLLLLNNDTELITPDAIESMLGYCQREDVGAVGAKLYYEDDTVQHAGVLVGVSEGADHVFLRYKKENPGYMGRAIVSQDLSAVTAACMLVKKALYEQVGGMDEEFVVAYNDVDFCLKLRDAGYLVVFDAFAEWYHYESLSRGYEETEEQKARFEKEKELLRKRWPVQMLGDPYYNINLSLKHGYYEI